MKKILLGIVGFLVLAIVVLFGLSTTAPPAYKIERSLAITAAAAQVFTHVEDIRSWEKWSPWKAHDATIVNTYSEVTKGVGASQTWTSEKSGAGTLTLT